MLQQQGQALAAPGRALASILVVDDDDLMAEAMTAVLSESGYHVERCADALEALARLTEGHVPDLILLDLMMPHMSGWEFRVEQRRHPGLASIPVIAMSADSSPQAAAIDAAVYLKKPLQNEVLVNSVKQVLEASRRQQREKRDAELERLSSLGVLAAGIAHEINNPLTFVAGNIELAQLSVQRLEAAHSDPLKRELASIFSMLDKAGQGAQRIATVVRNVSAFALADTDTLVSVNLMEVLDASIDLLGHEIRHHASLVRDYGELPRILGNPAKLGQVFVNLLTHALSAVSEGWPGPHEIRVSACVSTDQVVVSIHDTGPGIAPAIVARIFDPFFSAKPGAPSTGLGLAISHRLVSGMGGTISVESVVGHGSVFRVAFPYPRTDEAASAEADVMPEPGPAPRPRLLVIDDEELVCDMLEAMLVDAYDVEARVSPRDALAHILSGEEYDLILCDLMMAELSGMDLHAELLTARPDQAARMIFMTGGTFTTRASLFIERVASAHVEKPFLGPELRDVLASFLRVHGRASAAGHGVN